MEVFGQVRAIKKALKKYELEEKIPVFGMVKDAKHRTRALIDANGKEVVVASRVERQEDQSLQLLNFVTKLQDEVHNVAIEYNRKLSEKSMTQSKLDEIDGIGEKRRQDLLKRFGSVEAIKKAKLEEIASIKGINEETARKIKKKLDE